MRVPLVSVSMITYNHAPYIAKAIEGVLMQRTNFPIELVIGEDCSSDGTREIVLEYKKNHPDIIRVITSDKNVGAKKNGYRTKAACRGKYIAFCEGDDYWHHPEKLQKQVDYLENHPECGLVHSDYDVYHVESGNRISNFLGAQRIEIPESIGILNLIENKGGIGYGVLSCTVVAVREICMRIIQLDPYLHQDDHFLMGDTQMWAEIAALARLHFIPESLATHNIVDDSASRSRDPIKAMRFTTSCAELAVYLCNKYNLPESTRTKAEGAWSDSLAALALLTRDAELAEKARKMSTKRGVKTWLKYYAATNYALNIALRPIFMLGQALRRKRHPGWTRM